MRFIGRLLVGALGAFNGGAGSASVPGVASGAPDPQQACLRLEATLGQGGHGQVIWRNCGTVPLAVWVAMHTDAGSHHDALSLLHDRHEAALHLPRKAARPDWCVLLPGARYTLPIHWHQWFADLGWPAQPAAGIDHVAYEASDNHQPVAGALPGCGGAVSVAMSAVQVWRGRLVVELKR